MILLYILTWPFVIVRYLQSLQSKLNTRDVIYTEIYQTEDSADHMVRIPM